MNHKIYNSIYTVGKTAFSLATVLFLWIILLESDAIQAAVVEQNQAHKITKAWLAKEAGAFGRLIDKQIGDIRTLTDQDGQPLYHIVALKPDGFVIVSAEDGVEPIIGFIPEGFYDPSISNPLGALVSVDLPKRVGQVRTFHKKHGSVPSLKDLTANDFVILETEKKAIKKWNRLLAEDSTSPQLKTSLGSLSDIRVSPLIQSKWGQDTVNGNACYNYYTPPYEYGNIYNYPCGCVATAMAQYMRLWQYPTTNVGTARFTVYVDGISEYRDLRGGNGAGSPYNWNQMPLVPNDSVTLTQRQAIGAITHDASVAIETDYAEDGSGAYMSSATDALIDTFGYSNAVFGFHSNNNIGNALNAMINPNLDFGNPVILSIDGDGGHAILADGYGYSGSTLYHHLNMGWDGSNDVWYNLPDIDSDPGFDVVDGAIYNIYLSGTGEIISGRIMDDVSPVSGVTVTAVKTNGATYQATTNLKGIYAIAKVPSNSTYTVNAYKNGYFFEDCTVSTGLSDQSTSGNRWGVDFSNAGVEVQITKCKIAAGKSNNTDTLSFSGTMNASASDLSNAGSIVISIDSADMVNPYIQTFPVNGTTFKSGSYACTLNEYPLQSTFKFKTKTDAFSFSAKYADLTGLSCPITVTIDIGSYESELTLSETIVNGSKPCPLPLMMGVQDSLTADKFKAKFSAYPDADSFTVQGTFTLDGAYDKFNPLVIMLGSQTFTVSGDLFVNKNGIESCKSAVSDEGALVTAKLDFVKCTYSISVKNTDITDSGEVDFGLNCFGISLDELETVNISDH
jgi:hypothetical protein